MGTWARRDQLFEAGVGVWDLCLCRAEGVQAIYNPSSPLGKKPLKGLGPSLVLISPQGAVPHWEKPAIQVHGGYWGDRWGGACRAPGTSAALVDLGFEDFLELVCALFSGTDPPSPPFAHSEGHPRNLTEQNLRTCEGGLIAALNNDNNDF